ncbi:hypothetical protein [Streptomyces parvus]|uniref:hypothetical protein n=1 Tax=Streptomyces parvus TaxID=66428 RepID=UPI00332EF1A1
MGTEERETKRYLYTLLLGGFAGLALGALASWTADASTTEVLLSASGGGMAGVIVAAVAAMARWGAFRG